MTTQTEETTRQRDAARKRVERAAAKLVVIPPCADRIRRKKLEADDIAWLMYYFGPASEVRDPFTYEFVPQQRSMIDAFGTAIIYGGDQSVAASRGEGKTTILERMILKYSLQGILDFSVLFQATGALADNSLDTIKTYIEENALLRADYPEVCIPVRALENTPNRAHYQIVSGHRHDNGEPYEKQSSRFTWCGQEIIFPKVPGSPSSEAIIATRGLDSAVRGLKKRGRRPKLAAIDDPDTTETASSDEQAGKLGDRIDKAIGGSGSQTKSIARILLCTIPSRKSVAFKFTDTQQKPSWKGVRFKYLVKPPERIDLWDQYVQIREDEWRAQASGHSDDKHCRKSHQFYLDHREEMDAGAEVANPHRFNPELLPDGSQAEVSALQHYYNEVARIGPDAVATEYDNEPPEESEAIDSGLSAQAIQLRLSGYQRKIVPPGCVFVTQGIDVKKSGLHFVVKAWLPDATNYVIDYGFAETYGTTYNSDEGLELALHRAILARMEDAKYFDGEEKPVEINLTLIDSGWQSSAIYKACKDIGSGIFPAKGHGRSHGCATPTFYGVQKASPDRKPGDGWFMQKQTGGVWLVNCDTDRWKTFEHSRWMTQAGKAGAAYIFGELDDETKYGRLPRDAKQHFAFAKHITSEAEVEDIIRGILRRVWKTKAGRAQNHYLDASYLADVAAAIKGIRLFHNDAPKRTGRRIIYAA